MKIDKKSKYLMIIFIIPFLIQFACNSEHDFQKINFNWSEDYLGEIAQGFDPEMKYDFWALVRTGIPNENSLKIMYQTNDDPLVELDDLFKEASIIRDIYPMCFIT